MEAGPLYPIFVITLNWNLPNETIDCVQSVIECTTKNIQILVVDNGSTDLSVKQIRNRFGEAVTIIENKENLGFAGGMNVGIRQALSDGAESILLLNNDTYIDPMMIERMIECASLHLKAGIIGSVIYYSQEPDRIWRVGDHDSRWLPIPMRIRDRFIESNGSSEFKLDYITACGMFIREEVLERVGLLDEKYFMYYEDADYCLRVRQAGYEIWCAPQAKMWHKVSLSSHRQKPLMRYLQSWGRVRFYKTHQYGLRWNLICVYLILRSKGLIIGDLLFGRIKLIQPTIQGLLDGLRGRPTKGPADFN